MNETIAHIIITVLAVTFLIVGAFLVAFFWYGRPLQ